jgi:hypothetical protein
MDSFTEGPLTSGIQLPDLMQTRFTTLATESALPKHPVELIQKTVIKSFI